MNQPWQVKRVAQGTGKPGGDLVLFRKKGLASLAILVATSSPLSMSLLSPNQQPSTASPIPQPQSLTQEAAPQLLPSCLVLLTFKVG